MSNRAHEWIARAAVGAAAGLALGLAVGWLWPVQTGDAGPDTLRQDYGDDYVVMVATAYTAEGDLERARQRLALLDPDNPAAPLIGLAERLVGVGGSPEDIARLAHLAQDLGAATPALAPYLEASP